MRLDVAHHYWENKKNAVWFPQIFPVPTIEEAVKIQYEQLQIERPRWKFFGHVCVFFDYRQGEDVFGRTVIGISFAFLPKCRDPARSFAVIGPLLAHTPHDVSSIEAPLPWENCLLRNWQHLHLPLRLAIMATSGFFLLALLIALWGSLRTQPSGLSNEASSSTDTSITPPTHPVAETPRRCTSFSDTRAAQAPITISSVPLGKTFTAPLAVEVIQQNNAASSGSNAVQASQEVATTDVTPAIGEEFCSRSDLIENLYPCPKAFVLQQCREGTHRVAFADWLQTTDNGACDIWKRGESRKYQKIDISKNDDILQKKFFGNIN